MEWSRPRARSERGRAAVLAGVLCSSAPAQSEEGNSISWIRGDGAEQCPDERAFAAAVARRTKRPPALDHPRVLRIVVTRKESVWRAVLTVEGPDGPAKSRLETASSDCMPVFDAAALAASVVVGVASEHDHETYEELWEPYVVESQAIVRRSPFDGRQDAGVSSSPRRHAPVDHDNRLGLEIVQDLVRVPSADALCGPESAFATVRCYDGQRQVTNTDPSAQGGVMAGFLTPTQRVLASYERTLTGPFGAMVRAGLAFGDTAPAEAHEARFPPLHFELNARYRFGGPRVRGAAFAGAGVARLGSRFETSVLECHSAPPCDPLDGTGVFRQVVVHQPLGPAFATLGADVLWAVADDVGVLARAGGLFSFPEPSFVLQPSVGVSAGF